MAHVVPIEGLTKYDMVREPIPCASDPTSVLVVKQLLVDNELTCPVCQSVCSSTLITMDCLHRFCHECIISGLRLGNKECPTCRLKCPSKRNLRPDTHFDRLIQLFYPNLENKLQLEQQHVQKLVKSFDREAFKRRKEEGLKRQQARVKEDLRKRESRRRDSSGPKSGKPQRKRSRSSSDLAAKLVTTVPENVDYTVSPHPDRVGVPTIELSAITTSSKLPVKVLRKFVSQKVKLPESSLHICTKPPGGVWIELDDPDMTVGTILIQYWRYKKPKLRFHYYGKDHQLRDHAAVPAHTSNEDDRAAPAAPPGVPDPMVEAGKE